jgi:hypothetical protein
MWYACSSCRDMGELMRDLSMTAFCACCCTGTRVDGRMVLRCDSVRTPRGYAKKTRRHVFMLLATHDMAA